MNKIFVYHDFGAPSHYRALEAWASENGAIVKYYEFSFVRMFVKAVLRGDAGKIKRALINAAMYFSLLLRISKPNLMVLGVAPFDWRIVALIPIMAQSNAVHLHTSWPYWDGSFNAVRPAWKGLIALWKWALRRWVKHVYFVTVAAKNNFLASGFSVPSFSIVNHSLDVEIYKNNNQRSDSEVVVGYCGRLELQKGIDSFLEIARNFSSEHMRFIVIGDGPDRVQVEKAANERVVEYLGHISSQQDVANQFNRMSILLLPSKKSPGWEELFGMVLIEAAACGAFPIATKHVGPVEVIKEMNAGLLFDESSYVDEVSNFLRNLEVPDMSMKSREVRARYSVVELAKQWGLGLNRGI